jgi:rod shape-determining protein MreD
MDVAEGALLGQHALSYTILAYAAIALNRRVRMFSLASQAFHVVPLLLVNDLIVIGVRILAGAEFPGYRYFLGSLIAGVLWPVVSLILKLPQRPRNGDHV